MPQLAHLNDDMSPVGTFYAGTKALITCNLQIDKAVDIPVMVGTVWMGPQGLVQNGSSRSVILASQNLTGYNATLRINPLNIDDSGYYNCSWNISSDSPFVLPNTGSSSFQLYVQGTPMPMQHTCMCCNAFVNFHFYSTATTKCNHHVQHSEYGWICVLTGVYSEGSRWTGSCP